MCGDKSRSKPYRIIGAYDSETTNIADFTGAHAFPILHQIGIIGADIESITCENVERETTITLFRHTFELSAFLDDLADIEQPFVPVICCHNLAFDMWGLADWLNSRTVRVLAKSKRKPITFTVLDDLGNPRLVLWDTLIFSGQPLAQMGNDCGYPKAVGDWDYNLIRTPQTPLTDEEIRYATHDIYALLAWLGYWCRRNPDIAPQKLALNVTTKTGVVRERRRVLFDQKRGQGSKYNIGRFWMFLNRTEAPKTDDELYTMHACTRGGFTFTACKFAGRAFDGDLIAGYDAVSMHPAQMASHRYPSQFHEAGLESLRIMFEIVLDTPLDWVLERWASPFSVAFNACFRFTNLRLKRGTLFEEYGIAPLASARFTAIYPENEDNGNGDIFRTDLYSRGYQDSAVNPVFAFGKLMSADCVTLYISELAAWELSRCYEWDSVEPLGGYCTSKFIRPSDMAIASVCTFYRAKNEFKRAMGEYAETGTITNDDILRTLGIADTVILGMKHGTMTEHEIKQYYQLTKSNLNALFGIEASNEYRQPTELCASGIEYTGAPGIQNAPKNPKAWYQFGQRVVGWSRIAQIVAMELVHPYVKGIVCGDTDSIKVWAERDDLPRIDSELQKLARAIDKGKANAMLRFKSRYPSDYDALERIGHYECEFVTSRFCAGWNKAYIMDDSGRLKTTLAGVPAYRGLDGLISNLLESGKTFAEICGLVFGGNTTLSHDLTRLNARSAPEWGESYVGRVTDYLGNESFVAEPAAMALYPMEKTINDLRTAENRANIPYIVSNNGLTDNRHKILMPEGVIYIDEIL